MEKEVGSPQYGLLIGWGLFWDTFFMETDQIIYGHGRLLNQLKQVSSLG